MRKLKNTFLITSITFAYALGMPAVAAPVVFQGEDVVTTTSSTHPLSAIAATSFDAAVAALGGGSLITFESAPVGSFSNLLVAPGVTLTGADVSGANQQILNTSNFPSAPTLDGFNITPGGSKFVENQAGTLNFAFSTPVNAFGSYFTGLQQNFFATTLSFNDGSSQTINVPAVGTSGSTGAVAFVGLIDVGRLITSVTVTSGSSTSGGDYIGLDDVRFAIPSVISAVPEIGTWAMMIVGLGMVGCAMRRRRSTVAARVLYAR